MVNPIEDRPLVLCLQCRQRKHLILCQVCERNHPLWNEGYLAGRIDALVLTGKDLKQIVDGPSDDYAEGDTSPDYIFDWIKERHFQGRNLDGFQEDIYHSGWFRAVNDFCKFLS